MHVSRLVQIRSNGLTLELCYSSSHTRAVCLLALMSCIDELETRLLYSRGSSGPARDGCARARAFNSLHEKEPYFMHCTTYVFIYRIRSQSGICICARALRKTY